MCAKDVETRGVGVRYRQIEMHDVLGALVLLMFGWLMALVAEIVLMLNRRFKRRSSSRVLNRRAI